MWATLTYSTVHNDQNRCRTGITAGFGAPPAGGLAAAAGTQPEQGSGGWAEGSCGCQQTLQILFGIVDLVIPLISERPTAYSVCGRVCDGQFWKRKTWDTRLRPPRRAPTLPSHCTHVLGQYECRVGASTAPSLELLQLRIERRSTEAVQQQSQHAMRQSFDRWRWDGNGPSNSSNNKITVDVPGEKGPETDESMGDGIDHTTRAAAVEYGGTVHTHTPTFCSHCCKVGGFFSRNKA